MFVTDGNKWKGTDAVPGPGAERDVGVRMSAADVFRKEAFRIEFFRIGEVLRIAMQRVGEQQHSTTGWNFIVVCVKT